MALRMVTKAVLAAAVTMVVWEQFSEGQIYHDECRRFCWAPRLMNKYLHKNAVLNTREEKIPRTRLYREQNLPTPYRLIHSDEQDEYNYRQHYRLSVYLDDDNHVTKLKCC
ncbi:hypothetical protein GGF46_000128 [Coemansia sp. RSA 552]|nr:hypothetical protein GGF46_000128 [Coemansia sp. RSA 552]